MNLVADELLAALHAQAFALRLAKSGEATAGFVLALPAGADYGSSNYRWFTARYPAFVYVDRIVVDAAARSRGIGGALYEDLFALARGRAPLVACEVNVHPPNPRSLAFHARLGFVAVGEQASEGGTKRVRMLVRSVE